MNVYEAISAVQSQLAEVGIAKDRKASGGGASYAFRGIDDVYAVLSTLLAKHKLVIIPRMVSRECSERGSKNGGALNFVTVHAEFDFVSAIDGTKHTASTFGEAMDTSDKATNKAMSAAYKYMAFLTFCIPTEGDNDTENHDHRADGDPKITADQVSIIQGMLQASNIQSIDFCGIAKIASIPELDAAHFDGAVNWIKTQTEKKA